MDISNLVNVNTNQNIFLNNKANTKVKSVDVEKVEADKSNDGYAKKITIAKQGQAGYMRSMDLDEDGTLTLEEFNKYCQEHSISDTAKQKMLQMMNTSNSSNQILQHMAEEAERAEEERLDELEEDEETFNNVRDVKTKKDESTTFAKKGEVQYDEEMNINNDGKVTYKEYSDYCEKTLGKTKPSIERAEISKETRVAVESYKTFEPPEVEIEESFYEEVV